MVFALYFFLFLVYVFIGWIVPRFCSIIGLVDGIGVCQQVSFRALFVSNGSCTQTDNTEHLK